MLCGISTDFPVLSPTPRQVAHVLLTRPPLRQTSVTFCLSPLDLHVLGTPPAFVLSQDQTLKLIFDSLSRILTFSFALTQKNSDCFQRRLLCTSNFHLVIILHCLVFKDQSSYIIWKILRFFSYPAGESAADLYYVITPLFCCQYWFRWFFVVIRIPRIRNLEQRLRIYHISSSE